METMTVNDIEKRSIAAKEALMKNQLMQCFAELNLLLKELHEWWAINRKDELQTIYSHMVQYLLEGTDDPEQKQIFNRLKSDIFTLIDDVTEALMTQNSSEYEYTQRRYFLSTTTFQIEHAVTVFEKYELYKSLKGEIPENIVQLDQSLIERSEVEYQQEELFNHYWLGASFSGDDYNTAVTFIANNNIGHTPKLLIVSAVTLALLRRFDARKMQLLLSLAHSQDDELRQRVIVGLLLVMNRFAYRIELIPTLMQLLEELSNDSLFLDELENSFLQLVRTSETDSISKRVREELLPEMIKLGPKLRDKINSESISFGEDMEEKNPEWDSLLENDGVSDKLKEFGDLQMEGADVYVSTFAPLKNYSFFNNVVGWFMPFESDNSNINALFMNNNRLFKAFVKSPFLCNSDKYSFCISLMQMSQQQQNMMSDAFQQETEQLEDVMKDEQQLDRNASTKSISNQYIQDLYRFYTLNPHHSDFKNPLIELLEFYKTSLFKLLFKESIVRKRISEFYFSKNLYVESLDQFLALREEGVADLSNFQKIGFCYQQLMKYEEAIDAYQKAELLEPDNSWTLTRLAYCLRRTKQFELALEIYKRLSELYPEQLNYQNYLANCYYEIKSYDEALKIYYKLDYLQPDSAKYLRLIAWCCFIAQKLEQADKYYSKLLALPQPEAVDYLNAGHLAWIQKNQQLAHQRYLKAKALMEKKERFAEQFMRDAKYLAPYGIEPATMALMLDSLELFPE